MTSVELNEAYDNPTLSRLPPIGNRDEATTADTNITTVISETNTRVRGAGNGMENNFVERDSQPKSLTLAGDPKKIAFCEPKSRVCAAGSNNPVMINDPNTGKPQQVRYFDYNFHSMKKGVSSALLDVALLMANASQLKSLYLAGSETPLYYPLLVLLVISILLQIVTGCILVYLSKININDADENEHHKADVMNNVVVIAVFLLTIVNVFIAAIGISAPSPAKLNATNST